MIISLDCSKCKFFLKVLREEKGNFEKYAVLIAELNGEEKTDPPKY
ncbi:MAG: hypothetical protein GY765_37445 [bacterium]|nr:hypothetical protein [bacterium]